MAEPNGAAAHSGGGNIPIHAKQVQIGGDSTTFQVVISILLKKLRDSSVPIELMFLINKKKFSYPTDLTDLWGYISIIAALMTHSEEPAYVILITEM